MFVELGRGTKGKTVYVQVLRSFFFIKKQV